MAPCPQPPSPTYERLRDTISRLMRMSHVYQPLMLMELLGRRSLAEGFCAAVELSDNERDELLQLCRQRLDRFRALRGEEVFTHRSRHRTPISGS